MSLRAELDALRSKKPRTFAQWEAIADDEDKAIVHDAISDRTIPANLLASTLASNGVPITRETVIKLREGNRDTES